MVVIFLLCIHSISQYFTYSTCGVITPCNYFQSEVMQLRDQLSVMKSDRMRKETQMNEMELALTQKSGEVSHVQQQLQQVFQHNVPLTSTSTIYYTKM